MSDISLAASARPVAEQNGKITRALFIYPRPSRLLETNDTAPEHLHVYALVREFSAASPSTRALSSLSCSGRAWHEHPKERVPAIGKLGNKLTLYLRRFGLGGGRPGFRNTQAPSGALLHVRRFPGRRRPRWDFLCSGFPGYKPEVRQGG